MCVSRTTLCIAGSREKESQPHSILRKTAWTKERGAESDSDEETQPQPDPDSPDQGPECESQSEETPPPSLEQRKSKARAKILKDPLPEIPRITVSLEEVLRIDQDYSALEQQLQVALQKPQRPRRPSEVVIEELQDVATRGHGVADVVMTSPDAARRTAAARRDSDAASPGPTPEMPAGSVLLSQLMEEFQTAPTDDSDTQNLGVVS